jgi:hypothetical protein
MKDLRFRSGFHADRFSGSWEVGMIDIKGIVLIEPAYQKIEIRF